jgi:hypothetical protein
VWIEWRRWSEKKLEKGRGKRRRARLRRCHKKVIAKLGHGKLSPSHFLP